MASGKSQLRLSGEPAHFRWTKTARAVGECVFCKVINNETERYLVFEDEVSVAFLDLRPLFPGHCLLVPRTHYETLNDVPSEILGPLFADVKRLAIATEKAMKADGSFIAINTKVGQSVPHLHIHVVPRKFKDGLKGFFWPRHGYESQAELIEVQKRISKAMAEIAAGERD